MTKVSFQEGENFFVLAKETTKDGYKRIHAME